jgi:O-antigen/teichoic acid export membrane protein
MTATSILAMIFNRSDSDLLTEAGRSRERYRKATLSSAAAIAARIVSLAISLVTVPLTLKYLGLERYGMWMTISSVVAMFSFADLGMSNGLINLVAYASGRDDRDAIRHAVASAFWMLSMIAFILLVSMASIYSYIPWSRIFNVNSAVAVRESGPAVMVLVTCFAVNLPLGIVASIQNGLQNGFVTNIWNAIGSLISLCILLVAIHHHAGLPILVFGLSGATVLASILNAGQLFFIEHPWMLPRLHFFSKKTSLLLMQTGLMFFCMQVATALGYQSDNLVIAHLMGAQCVAGYAVPSRLFNIYLLTIGIITSPMWPAYAHALAGGDIQWIRRTFKSTVIGVVILTCVAMLVLVFFTNVILSLWVGPGIRVTFALSVTFAIRCILSAYLQPLSFLLNGIGKLKAQAIISILMSIINLALSILFVRHFGIIGAILGTVVSEFAIVVIPSTVIVVGALERLETARSKG